MRWVLLSPLLWGIVLALLLAWRWRQWPRGFRRCGIAGLAICYLLATPLGSTAVFDAVAVDGPSPCTIQPEAIVVLSGGADDLAPVGYSALTLASLRRTMHGVAVWRNHGSNLPLVLSGGTRSGGRPESLRMATLARDLGVPARFIRSEDRSGTTWENAFFTAALQPAVPRRVWLVTSAIHMHRSRYAMELAGFKVCIAPAGTGLEPHLPWYQQLLPDSGSLQRSEAAIHELIGMAWYRIKNA